jgi:ATP-binding cassette subfamily B protein
MSQSFEPAQAQAPEAVPEAILEAVSAPKGANLFSLLSNYKLPIIGLVVLALLANSLNLLIPQFTAHAIDAYSSGHFVLRTVIAEFGIAALFIYIFSYLQALVQTYASERVAKDIRNRTAAKISLQTYAFIQKVTPAKLLTNLTSDADAVKNFVSQAIVSIVSSVFLIIGASILLLLTNWRLALVVLAIIPIIGGTFFFILSKVRVLFRKSQEVIDWLNKVINESILGSSVIRVLNSEQNEYNKFLDANNNAQGIGLSILRLFATLVPIITFIANMATLGILALGGHFVIAGSMSLGNFTAFNSYLGILIFPILVIGFMSNVIAQAGASYGRIYEVLSVPDSKTDGTLVNNIGGEISAENVRLSLGGKDILKDVSFKVAPRSKTAIIGPTAAGKTQLLYLFTGLLEPNSGKILFDGKPVCEYDPASLHRQVGFVFQDSIIFNMTLRENIAFSQDIKENDMQRAIETAELNDFIDALPEKLETIVSERGNSLSGGQKQRIMLARALALNPRVLLLDDFTARVDASTEQRILANLAKNYPDLTLVSVTQKIASIEHYEQIILLMEGEILASGTHQELMHTSPEYVQIFDSQQSTNKYELHPE